LAIGVGNMTVTSYINQPLQANIAVLQPDGLVESEVLAGLASPDDFDRLGIERHYSLNSLEFMADFSRPSRPIITVTTEDPILEPYLSFLLELKWPEGRVLREYTVFLDLPPRRDSPVIPESRDRRRLGEVALDQYRVAPNDALGAIAAAFRPSDISIDQMMLAIKAANPDSFMRDNINGIRAGVSLTIPSDFARVSNARAASAEVANEWERWKTPRSRGLRIGADNELLELTEPSADIGPDKPVSTSDVAETSVPATPETRSDPGNPNLALIETRLSALSQQLSEIQQVVDSKDQEIARLKAELAERPVRGVEAQAPTVAEQATQLVQPASESGSANFSGWLWIVAVIGVLALGWFNRHRLMVGGREDTGEGELGAPPALGGGLDDLVPVPSNERAQAKSGSAPGPERGYGESLLTGYAADQTLADAVAEADIYVAYGRHQHALDTLEAVSAAEPNNASGLLKMLDIYMSLDRIAEASALVAQIEGTGDTAALASAKSRLDAHQVALEGDEAAHELAASSQPEVVAADADDTLDISLDLEFQEAAKAPSEVAEADAASALDTEDPPETALDLALSYIDMGDKAGAAELLQTVLSSGDDAQREHAQSLLDSLE
jgi:pilus assembly protein FimV